MEFHLFLCKKKELKNQQQIRVKELLSVIPDDKIVSLAASTQVDYCTKVLYGRSVFYMLLYGLLETERASLRTMEDIFNSVKFKFLFNLDQHKSVRHSSISDRLSVMDVVFFEQLFEHFYNQLSHLYPQEELLKHNIVRVDSTMVAETSAKLSSGMCVGQKKDGKKQIKYTIGFDGQFPCAVEVFDDKSCLSEDLTIPQVVLTHARKTKHNIYVFDRGVSKRSTFDELEKRGIEFVTRLKESASYQSIEVKEGVGRTLGNLLLLKDETVRLYIHTKGKAKKATEEIFRLITTENTKGERLLFLTNIMDLDAEVITEFYRSRWDIEVFFRFVKQELNFSHFMSTNQNGIKIILYMTLILSMLLLIYKRLNNWGYKTAKRRFAIELDELIIAMIVRFCGGNPALVFR